MYASNWNHLPASPNDVMRTRLESVRLAVDVWSKSSHCKLRSRGKKTGDSFVPELPGVMAYGGTEESALRKVKAIALQVLADMIESGDEMPQPLKVLFAA